jgi:hypothetical protein
MYIYGQRFLRHSRQVRLWFCQKALFAHPSRFCEYILECPSAEVRTAFVRIIVFVAHFSLNDGPAPVPPMLQQTLKQSAAAASSGENPPVVPGTTLSDHLLQTVLALLWMEVRLKNYHLFADILKQIIFYISGQRARSPPAPVLLLVCNVRVPGRRGEDPASAPQRPRHVYSGGSGRGTGTTHQIPVRGTCKAVSGEAIQIAMTLKDYL